MTECECTKVPVMLGFHNLTGSQTGFHISEVNRIATLGSVLLAEGPEDWTSQDNITVKVSSSRSGNYDKFSLTNSISLVSKILKTDVIWIIFEKKVVPVTMPTRNAFEYLKNASSAKGLPEQILDPFNQKQELFNRVLEFLHGQDVQFYKSDCAPRQKNRKTGAATELVYEITDIVWRVGLAEKQLMSSELWKNVPDIVNNLATFQQKSKEPIKITQTSAKSFATFIRETSSKALMANQNLSGLKLAMLACAEIFVKYSEYLKKHLEAANKKAAKDKFIASGTEAVILQLSNREKVTAIEAGNKPLTNPTVIKIFQQLTQSYQPINISTILPANRYSRSSILHRDLPNQAPEKIIMWTFDNGGVSPQSIFVFKVEPGDSIQTILDRTNELKPKLQKMQKFFFPHEFYQQFYDRIGAVTGISKQDLKLINSMVMGDDRSFDGDVKRRFEDAVMSGDPDYVYDMRFFNGRKIKYKEYLMEFRRAVEEYMVEDRGRHEVKYDGTVVSKVSFGFSLKQMFKEVCDRVRKKNPECPLPTSESMISRYLIPRTKSACEAACKSEPLIPLKLAMQQKVIEKPNVDAHYNAAAYKYLRSFACEFGPDLVCMVGWDDKTGVDVGEVEQPTVATQHAQKSWVHNARPVGEGQHSFHKTNLTPSVRLVHMIGSSIEDSFYRGLPQLVIKDSIFQHSTSARHATEFLQMLQANPQLLKPVLILTNDGGVDHTIRHERNVVTMLALFLRLPETLVLINFQMAAYRSAYHPVEKLNCILNLSWNGVSLCREPFEDPVLEKSFQQSSSMAEVRTNAERHPGLKDALLKSLAPSIKVLEDRAKQASLKENYFETFNPASDEEIKEFLSVVKEVDAEFDVDRFMDKKKPYHYSPLIKNFLEKNVKLTHYSLTFMRHSTMSKEFLDENFPDKIWPTDLEPIPCPVIDKDNPERYLSYEKVKNLLVKDFSDACRPGACLKVPSNIPFTKTKLRALYGADLVITCEVCNKSRVAYFANKPTSAQIKDAKGALKNTRYVCGGRVSSFGRSLTVMEEIAGNKVDRPEVDDEIENENLREMEGPVREEVTEEMDELEEEPVRKRKKLMIIESDEESGDEADDSEVIDILSNPEQNMLISVDVIDSFEPEEFELTQKENVNNLGVSDSIVTQDDIHPTQEQEVLSPHNITAPCSFCAKFETGHQCKFCHLPCCNLCNTMDVDELTDIVCPNCPQENSMSDNDEPVEKTEKKGRGRPRKKVLSGTILIPLCAKKKRGRPSKQPVNAEIEIDDEFDDENNNETAVTESHLTEIRILGSGSILTKLFVDEALVCDSPIEPHMFDILLSQRMPLPCSYCGEKDDSRLFSKLTDEDFPLCKGCEEKGRGAGKRRKSRKIKPKPVKKAKPQVISKKRKRGKLI